MEGYDGYSFETVRNYDNFNFIKNGNLTSGRYFKDNYKHEISPYELLFIKQRLNHDNNAFKFYLKSMGYDLEKYTVNNTIQKPEEKIVQIPEEKIEKIIPIKKVNYINHNTVIDNLNKKTIQKQIITVKNK